MARKTKDKYTEGDCSKHSNRRLETGVFHDDASSICTSHRLCAAPEDTIRESGVNANASVVPRVISAIGVQRYALNVEKHRVERCRQEGYVGTISGVRSRTVAHAVLIGDDGELERFATSVCVVST